eukprot:GHVU01103161.1.p1 GENE.GHVU01103161.1~~GHVU01103161.1.p1  ORF type:complete len:195 (-),score=16.89 GHVU01103161.1:202-786(-)
MCGPPAGHRITDPAEIAELAEAAREDRRQRREYRALCFQVLLLWGLSGCFCARLRAQVPTSFLVRKYYWDTPVTSEDECDSGDTESLDDPDLDQAAWRQRLEDSGLASWLPGRRQLATGNYDRQAPPPLPPVVIDSGCSHCLWSLEGSPPLALEAAPSRRSPDAHDIAGTWLLSLREVGWLPPDHDSDPDSDSD